MPIESDELWDELQDALLQAVGHAERQNTDPDDAARRAVGDITNQDYANLVGDLADRRLLKATMTTIGERLPPIDAQVAGLTPTGRERVRSAPVRRPIFLDEEEHEKVEAFVTLVIHELDSEKVVLASDDEDDLRAQLDTLIAQNRSPKPRRSIVRNVLKVVAAIGANVAADLVSSEASNLLHILGV